MKRNIKMGISVGGPTIIMIFVVLCLTTLGTLSLVTANADLKLTQKTVVNTEEFYAADNLGEQFLSQIDEALNQTDSADLIAEIPGTSLKKNAYGFLSISHIIEINDRQTLIIELTTDVGPADAANYSIKSWKVVNNDYWRYENYETPFQDAIPQNN